MRTESKADAELMCPSAQPDVREGVVVGVVTGPAQEPRLGYLKRPIPVNQRLLELARPAKPTEVFRLAAPCAKLACIHFDGSSCRLVGRIAQLLEPVVDELPNCHLRPTCQWWWQEGAAACMRCPQIVTELYGATPEQQKAAEP